MSAPRIAPGTRREHHRRLGAHAGLSAADIDRVQGATFLTTLRVEPDRRR